MLYIDDGIIMAQGEDDAATRGRDIKKSLEAAGLVVNEEKSHCEPSQETEWLGFTLDTGWVSHWILVLVAFAFLKTS